MKHLVVLGAGELGQRVCRLWVEGGGRVSAITHTPDRHQSLIALGAHPRLWRDLGTEWWRESLADSLLLLSVAGAERQREVLVALQAALGAAHGEPTRRFAEPPIEPPVRPRFALLISSTGVYVRSSASAVGDNSALADSPRAQRLLEVEQLFVQTLGDRTCSLRAGGLYRAGRGPFSAFARRRTLPRSDLDQSIALIHYDDLAAAAMTVLEADGAIGGAMPAFVEPVPIRGRFYFEAATRLGMRDLAESLARYRDVEVPVRGLEFARTVLAHPQHPRWQDALD